MPHFVIEYARDIEQQINISELLEITHRVGVDSGLMKSEDIKVRARPYDHYKMFGAKDTFVHTTIFLLEGLMSYGFTGLGSEPTREDISSWGPYVIKLREFDSVYVQKLIQYREYLSTDGMAEKAADIEVVMQDFYDALKQYPEINDKKVKALHNELARTVKGSMRKLVEPDFPTFVPNAQSAIRMVI